MLVESCNYLFFYYRLNFYIISRISLPVETQGFPGQFSGNWYPHKNGTQSPIIKCQMKSMRQSWVLFCFVFRQIKWIFKNPGFFLPISKKFNKTKHSKFNTFIDKDGCCLDGITTRQVHNVYLTFVYIKFQGYLSFQGPVLR